MEGREPKGENRRGAEPAAAAHRDGCCASHAEQSGDVVIEASAMPVDPAASQQLTGLLTDLSNTGAEKQQSL